MKALKFVLIFDILQNDYFQYEYSVASIENQQFHSCSFQLQEIKLLLYKEKRIILKLYLNCKIRMLFSFKKKYNFEFDKKFFLKFDKQNDF